MRTLSRQLQFKARGHAMRKAALVFAPLLVVLGSPAQADIVVVTGNDSLNTFNVTFTDQSATSPILGSVGALTNIFSVSGATVSPGDLLVSNSNVISGSGSDLTSLTFSLTDASAFDKLVINLGAAVNGTVSFTVLGINITGGVFQDDFTVDANAQNFFTFYAINGQHIQSITASGLNGTTLTSVRNVRVGGLSGVATVPEPSTWAMMLFGFAGIGLTIRRRRQIEMLPQLA